MKFIVSVVILALACSASAGVLQTLPLAYTSPYAYAPYAYAPHISLSQGIPAPLAYSAWPAAYPATAALTLSHPAVAHTTAVHAPLVAPAASYVAQTRGATHTAPLPGHVQSVASQNLEAAPGTY